ncbi:protein gamma response 1 [Wolffia australiana]
MEGHQREMADDSEVLAGLSTVLVATIQEVKDRINHIEFIFCNQLFPRVRSRQRPVKNQIRTPEDWIKKEASLLRQIADLRLQKDQAESESKCALLSLDRERAEKAEILEKLEAAERTSEAAVLGLRNQTEVKSEEALQLDRRIEELRLQNANAEEEIRRGMQLQIDQKDLALAEEISRRKQLAGNWSKLEERYKQLKSQYKFLLGKTGLAAEASTPSPSSLPPKRRCSQDRKTEEDRTTGKKWVDTRGREEDFLDGVIPAVGGRSDGPEPDAAAKKAAESGKRAGEFKFVEPVRKKADRENLTGVECKQCKKFYDAVLPRGGGAAAEPRCEHHQGVSRHRFRHPPPMTPEGFWNIGFDSEDKP